MRSMDLIKGIGIGMVAGAALGAAMRPKKRKMKSVAGRALRSAGEIAENISNVMGM